MNKKLRFIIGIIIVVIIISLIVLLISDVKTKKDYYKTQMLNFCELSHAQRDLIITLKPSLDAELWKDNKNCSEWVLK